MENEKTEAQELFKDDVELLKYQFSKDELAEMAKDIAGKIKAMGHLQDEKKSVAAEYTSQEKSLEIRIKDLGRLIEDGFEYRKQPCLKLVDYEHSQVYYFMPSQLKFIDIEGWWAEAGSVQQLVENLAQSEAKILPVKNRMLESWERQGQLFDDQPGDDVVVDTGEGAEVDAEFYGHEQFMAAVGDTKALQNLLGQVLKKKPTLKTITGFTVDEFNEANTWAAMQKYSNSIEDPDFQGVPTKPAFLGAAK